MSSDPSNELPQACAVPFRYRQQRVEFCLITSLNRRKWGFPKGIVEPHQTIETAALAEAYEEAGLAGEIIGQPLGDYADFKWNRPLRVHGRLMCVSHELAHWPEDTQRQRRWCTAKEARELVARQEQLELLEQAIRWLKQIEQRTQS
ncbi:MAG: NUDIX domain-containing protein [Pirellulales bacterium]|nr:NUDIX domain-containing protein [Pirellulales bacterium]